MKFHTKCRGPIVGRQRQVAVVEGKRKKISVMVPYCIWCETLVSINEVHEMDFGGKTQQTASTDRI